MLEPNRYYMLVIQPLLNASNPAATFTVDLKNYQEKRYKQVTI